MFPGVQLRVQIRTCCGSRRGRPACHSNQIQPERGFFMPFSKYASGLTRLCLFACSTAAFCLLITDSNAQTVSNGFWQAQNIYQIVTDRFFDGDASNNNAEGNYNPGSSSGSTVHGGDFKGIEQKLDYIKALGATAIWISPIVQNAS